MGKPGKMIGISIVIIVVTVISLVLALPSSAETYSGNAVQTEAMSNGHWIRLSCGKVIGETIAENM